MKGLFLMGVVLGSMVYLSAGGSTCATQAKVSELNAAVEAIAGVLVPIQANGGNLTVLLTGICNTTNGMKMKAETIQQLVGECVDLLNQPALSQLQFEGRTFLNFMNDFADLDEMCKCAPYLELAYAMTTIPIVMPVTNGVYPVIGSAPTVCYENSIVNQLLLPKNLLSYYVNNMNMCPNIWRYAGFDSEDQLRRVRTFSADLCPFYKANEVDCSIKKSTTQEFRSCIDKAKSITGDMAQERIECSNYDCVEDNMSECGEIARRIFRFTANILLKKPANSTVYIGEEKCNAASVAQVPVLLLVSLVAMWILK